MTHPAPAPAIAVDEEPDVAVLATPELEERLCTWAGRVAAATGEFLRLLAEFDAREAWAGVRIQSCAHWLSWRCGMSLATAHDHVRVARRLRSLPVTTAAFGAGQLSYSKVRAICRVATPRTEGELVDLALSATASQVERVVRTLPTAAPDDVPGAADRARRAPQRRVRWRTDEETGRISFSVTLEPEEAALVLAVLRQTAAARSAGQHTKGDAPDEPDVVGARTAASGSFATQVLTDTFAVAAAGLAGVNSDADEQEPTVNRPTAEVVVHVGADLSRGHVEDGSALAPSVIERLACEDGIRLASHGSDGRTQDLGRRCRRPNRLQLRVLAQRDGCCTVPGCGRTRFLQAHHVIFWSRGGRTELDNLLLLCGEHHRALHDSTFTIQRLGRQRFRFTDPRCTVIEYAPPLRGRRRDVQQHPRHRLIHGDSLTPDWAGDPLTRDGIGVIVDSYVRNRGTDADRHSPPDPWAAAA